MNRKNVEILIQELRSVQTDFFSHFGIADIITNSKIFEVLIANALGHDLIPGFAGHRDAKDKEGGEYEYKHYKESSSNHTWTFNDFSDTIFTKLENIEAVIFAHIQDENTKFPKFDWYYSVPGNEIASYLRRETIKIKNKRKMVNVSSSQIEKIMGIKRTNVSQHYSDKRYSSWIKKLINIAIAIEKETGTEDILTSNKFWELLVSLKLDHSLLSEQAKDDAKDSKGNLYEHKVAKKSTWSFEDISPLVLKRYLLEENVILATVDKEQLVIREIYCVNPKRLVSLLRIKLAEKAKKYKENNKEIRRLQISLSLRDIKTIGAKILFPSNNLKTFKTVNAVIS